LKKIVCKKAGRSPSLDRGNLGFRGPTGEKEARSRGVAGTSSGTKARLRVDGRLDVCCLGLVLATRPIRSSLRVAVLVVCILAVSGSAASAAPDYRYHAVPWPGGVVRYYNAVPSQGWALWQAVAAWNRSGARVRFVATSKRRAQLVIRTDPSVASCEKASATVGYVRRATVLIFPRNDRSQRCNKYTAARALAHELGHVLGLLHENGGCAAMNSSGSYRGAAMCASGRDWEWRCRLLEGDDVRGIAALYGGAAKPDRRPSPLCPLYDSVTPPREVAASYVPETGVVLTFGAAADPTVPPFLAGLAYLVLVNSLVSLSLLFLMLRHGEAAERRESRERAHRAGHDKPLVPEALGEVVLT